MDGMEAAPSYEVAVIYAGALERTEFFDSLEAAEAFATREAKDCYGAAQGYGADTDAGEDWRVCVSEHWCRYSDVCECSQWWQDDGTFADSETYELPAPGHACAQCGRDLNPAAWILGPVCGQCCRANHRKVAS